MFARRLSSAVVGGLILAGIFAIFFSTLLSWILKGAWDAQIAAATISAPLSALALVIIDPLLEAIGGYESPTRNAVVWFVIFLAGCLQYFVVGFIFLKFFWDSSEKEEN